MSVTAGSCSFQAWYSCFPQDSLKFWANFFICIWNVQNSCVTMCGGGGGALAGDKHFVLLFQCFIGIRLPWRAAGLGWPCGELPGSPQRHEPPGAAGQLFPIHAADPPVAHQHSQRGSLGLQRESGEYSLNFKMKRNKPREFPVILNWCFINPYLKK